MSSIFDQGLARNPANFASLSPLSLLRRVERVYPDLPAVIHGRQRYSWRETARRCRQLASALARRGEAGGGPRLAVEQAL